MIAALISVAVSLVVLACAVAWGSKKITQALDSRSQLPEPDPGLPAVPPPTEAEVQSLVARIKRERDRRMEEFGRRGGFPEPTNTRPGRYVHEPED